MQNLSEMIKDCNKHIKYYVIYIHICNVKIPNLKFHTFAAKSGIIYLSIYLFIYLFVYLFIHLCICEVLKLFVFNIKLDFENT